ncbi:MAG: hypothetical protein JWM57_490, partial [Phycisphaerales bacterium]|nr:hypothetical protein [Phycisphaerales bacterium]
KWKSSKKFLDGHSPAPMTFLQGEDWTTPPPAADGFVPRNGRLTDAELGDVLGGNPEQHAEAAKAFHDAYAHRYLTKLGDRSRSCPWSPADDHIAYEVGRTCDNDVDLVKHFADAIFASEDWSIKQGNYELASIAKHHRSLKTAAVRRLSNANAIKKAAERPPGLMQFWNSWPNANTLWFNMTRDYWNGNHLEENAAVIIAKVTHDAAAGLLVHQNTTDWIRRGSWKETRAAA